MSHCGAISFCSFLITGQYFVPPPAHPIVRDALQNKIDLRLIRTLFQMSIGKIEGKKLEERGEGGERGEGLEIRELAMECLVCLLETKWGTMDVQTMFEISLSLSLSLFLYNNKHTNTMSHMRAHTLT